MHMIIFLHPDSKIHSPEELDTLLSADFPDPETDPELFELVKTLMVHTPCGNEHDNPNAPCIVNGTCSKFFPKGFCDTTVIDGDSYA